MGPSLQTLPWISFTSWNLSQWESWDHRLTKPVYQRDVTIWPPSVHGCRVDLQDESRSLLERLFVKIFLNNVQMVLDFVSKWRKQINKQLL